MAKVVIDANLMISASYLIGLPDRGISLAMGYMHGARNASVAVIVASSAFSDQPNVMLMIATIVILILVVLILVSSLCKIKPGPVPKLN